MSETKLLTREEFKQKVFERDNYKCVVCKDNAVDAHHLMERKLFLDGGYYLDNGVSLCEKCHLFAEKTIFDVEFLRSKAGIENIVLPYHLEKDQKYDKWGNPIITTGQRLRGELFYDENVQKMLIESGKINLVTKYVKYPKTYHLPWSESLSKDDKMLPSIDQFIGKRVIVTEKMDGENTSMYNDYLHARSVDGSNHETRNWVKQFRSKICYDIPDGWRICGENLYAKHSIGYNNLKSYFYGFSVWNDMNICLSWDETIEYFKLLNITPVNILYDEIFNEEKIKNIYNYKNYNIMEGYVMRVADSFKYSEFRNLVGKYVRKNHLQTSKHWLYGQKIEKNTLR